MSNAEKTIVENIEENEFVSDLLKGLEQALRNKTDFIEIQKKPQPNLKGEIILAIAVGIATNTIYDALKALIRMYKGRSDYDSSKKIKIDDDEYSLEEIEKK